MAHRFNNQMQRKTPKPHASERTWSRWRGRHDIETKQDKIRRSRIEEIKEKMMERMLAFAGIKKSGNDLVIKEK